MSTSRGQKWGLKNWNGVLKIKSASLGMDLVRICISRLGFASLSSDLLWICISKLRFVQILCVSNFGFARTLHFQAPICPESAFQSSDLVKIVIFRGFKSLPKALDARIGIYAKNAVDSAGQYFDSSRLRSFSGGLSIPIPIPIPSFFRVDSDSGIESPWERLKPT